MPWILGVFERHLYFTAISVTFYSSRAFELTFPFAEVKARTGGSVFHPFSSSRKEAEEFSLAETKDQENFIVRELRWNGTLESELPKMEGNCFDSSNSNVIPEECFQLSQGHWQGRHILQLQLSFFYKYVQRQKPSHPSIFTGPKINLCLHQST